MIEQAADAVGGFLVDAVAVAGQVERLVEFSFCLGMVRLSGLKPAVQPDECGADPVLFFFEEVEGDRSGVVRFGCTRATGGGVRGTSTMSFSRHCSMNHLQMPGGATNGSFSCVCFRLKTRDRCAPATSVQK